LFTCQLAGQWNWIQGGNTVFSLAVNTFPVCPQEVPWTKSVTSEVSNTDALPAVKWNDHRMASHSFWKLFHHREFWSWIIRLEHYQKMVHNTIFCTFCLRGRALSCLLYWSYGVDKWVLKNAVFWDVTPCGSCKDRRFGGS
jgi:hypothetical protein